MAKLDVGALLKQAASVKKPVKSKSKTPEVQITSLDAEVQKWLKAKQDEENAKAAKGQAEEKILPAALDARKKSCREAGSFESSIVVNQAVLVSTQNKYSPIDLDKEEELKKAFGDDWEKYFTQTTEIALTAKATSDPDTLRKIIEAVGVEKFKEFLDVSQVFKPTEALHHGITMDDKIDAKAQKLVDAGILKPYKASVKAK